MHNRRLNDLLPTTADELQSESKTESQGLGEALFSLLSSWPVWVERRMHSVEFADVDTFRVRVSVDFILPDKLPWYLSRPAGTDGSVGEAVNLVPLAMLDKSVRIGRFSLRNESGMALAALSQRQHGPISAAVLLAAARAFTEVEDEEPVTLSRDVLTDLWNIAIQPQQQAAKVFNEFGLCRSSSDSERRLREQLAVSRGFQLLARDFAEGYPLLTPMRASTGRRRVVKFEYEAPSRLTTVASVSLWNRRSAAKTTTDIERITRSDTGASIQLNLRTLRDRGIGKPPEERPLRNRPLTLRCGSEVIRASTDHGGGAQVKLAPGEWTLEVPDKYLPVGSSGPLLIGQQPPTEVTLRYALGPVVGTQSDERSQSLRSKVLTALGQRPKRVEIPLGALSHAASFHFELVIPDGLQAAGARIDRQDASRATATAVVERLSPALTTARWVHMPYRPEGMGERGVATVDIVSRVHTIARAGVFATVLTVATLAAVFVGWRQFVTAPTLVTSLLLVVPAGTSAWVARSLEHPFTTEVLAAMRALAAGTASVSLVAALTLSVSQTDEKDLPFVSVTSFWLLLCLLVAIGALASFVGAYLCCRRANGSRG